MPSSATFCATVYRILLLLTFYITNPEQLCSQHFFYRRFTIEDGLLSSDNYQTIQDKTGYIWICSKNGVVRFNGYTFKTFTTHNGLPINDIWELFCDSHNRIWIRAFTKGAFYIEHGKVKSIRPASGINNLFVTKEYRDTLYFVEKPSQRIVYSKHYYLAPNGNFGQYMKLEEKGYLFDSDFRKERIIFYTKSNHLQENLYLKHLSTGKIASTNERLAHLGNTKVLPLECYNVLSCNYQYDHLYIVSTGKLLKINSTEHFGGKLEDLKLVAPPLTYAARVNGYYRYYTNILTLKRNYRYENRINAMYNHYGKDWFLFVDRDRNMWFTLMRGEILFVPAFTESIESFEINENGIQRQGIQSLYNAGKYIIILNNAKQIYYFDKELKTFHHLNYSPQNYVNCIENPFTGDLYAVGSDEIVQLNRQSPDKQRIFMDRRNKLFVKGMIFLTKNRFVLYDGTVFSGQNNSLKVIDTAFTTKEKTQEVVPFYNSLIVRTSSSLILYDKQSHQKIRKMPYWEVNAICRTKKGLLLGTNGRGLVLLKPDLTTIYLGLKNTVIYDIKINSKWLFLATNKGLFVLNPSTWQTVRIRTRYDGLSSTEINSLCLDDKYIYIGTKKGLNQIPLAVIHKKAKSHSQLHMERIFVNNIPIGSAKKLASHQNNIQFGFEAISFSSMGLNSYRHRLVGYDNNWQYSNVKTIVYNNLQPGNYKLIIHALDHDKKVISSPLTYNFSIEPHFLQTITARVVMILLALALIGYIILLIVRYMNKRNRQKEHLLQLELRALRAQLNPHFVFNSLNSLQNILILKGEQEANRHIHAFSGLMRKVLDNSKNETISLAEEMTFLRNYVTLEENRLSDNLHFEITYTGTVDTDEIRFPVMIFQPIVENSIIHGLSSKKGLKALKISFTLENKNLITIIEDNGIGRQKAAEQNSGRTHKSWASTILREKINVFNQIRNNSIRFEIIDLTDNEGEPAGTRVIVYLKTNLPSSIANSEK